MPTAQFTAKEIAAQALSVAATFLELNYPCRCDDADPDCDGEIHEAGALLALLWPILRQPATEAVTDDVAVIAVPRRGAEALTAGELIQQLVKLDPNAVVCRTAWDAGGDFAAVYGIAGIDTDGQFTDSRTLNSWFGPEPAEDTTYLEGTTP